jgi:hypothetical protein
MAEVPKDIMEAAYQYASSQSITDPYRSYVVSAYISAALSERERRTSQGVTVPAGWALVPIEPTQAMLDEACSTAPHVIITYTKPHERDGSVPLIPVATWRAMLAARPAAPSLSTSAGGAAGLSVWSGWDKSDLPWTEAKHKDAVCRAVFGPTWSMEDAETLIGFIDLTWSAGGGERG